MTTLRNIWADLVEKRLWPIAVLLLAGVVAVPVVLAKNPEPVPTPVANAVLARDGAGDKPTLVTLNAKPAVREHDGRGRDPFVQPKGSTPQKAQALQSSTTTGGGATPTPTGGTDTGGSGTTGTGTTPSKPKSTPKAPAANYVADLRFGQADSMKTLRDVARLTPLPSASSPFFVFLGVKEDGKTLVFLVSSDAKATGDGTCKPSKNNCETIELKVGDTEFFDLTTDAGVQQYQMDIIKVSKTSKASSAKGASAARAGAKASKADRRILRKVLDGRSAHLMGGYRWVPERGILVRVPAWAHAG
jgi:hypothetical protein